MRCFVAVDIPKDKTKLLIEAQDKLKFGNFTTVKDFHITLRFLGDLTKEQVATVRSRLKEVRFKKFFLTFADLGVFPSQKFIKVIWVGTHGEGIYELKKLVNDVLSDFHNKDANSFISHITLARVKYADNEKLLRLINNIVLPETEFEIKDFKLKQSILTKDGPIYKDIETYPLF